MTKFIYLCIEIQLILTMKKTSLCLIVGAILLPNTLCAQFKVLSNGSSNANTFSCGSLSCTSLSSPSLSTNTIKNEGTVLSKRLGLGISSSVTPESYLAVGNEGNSYTTACLLSQRRIGVNVNTAPEPNGAIGIQSFATNSVPNPYIPYNPYNIAVRAIAGEMESVKDVRSFGISALLHGTVGTALYAGTTPYEFTHNGKYAAYIHGDATLQNGTLNAVVTQTNDSTLMQSVTELDEAAIFDKLDQLQAVQYTLQNPTYICPYLTTEGIKKDTTLYRFSKDFVSRTRYGFAVAQFGSIFPELVYALPDETEGIEYTALVPILSEGLKIEHRTTMLLQDSIAQLSAQLQQAQTILIETISELEALKKAVYGTSAPIQAQGDAPALGQNTPNPFSEQTEISIHLPIEVQSAYLFIYNLAGEQQKEYVLSERGDFTLTIEAATLYAGHYIYTLVVDGQIIDSKHLILTK